jgi:hypothetical protein
MQFPTGGERNPEKWGLGNGIRNPKRGAGGGCGKSKNCKKQREWVKADE